MGLSFPEEKGREMDREGREGRLRGGWGQGLGGEEGGETVISLEKINSLVKKNK